MSRTDILQEISDEDQKALAEAHKEVIVGGNSLASIGVQMKAYERAVVLHCIESTKAYAAAYLQQTGLPADEVELVITQHSPTSIGLRFMPLVKKPEDMAPGLRDGAPCGT